MKLKHFLALSAQRMFLASSLFALFALFGMPTLVASAASPSFVRIIHASPDVGTADIFVDGAKFLSSMPFGAVTDYKQLPAGTYKVQIALIGTGPNAAVISQTLSIQTGVAYTVAALGTNSTGFSLKVFVDNNQVSSGIAKVRVYHLSPGTGSVSVKSGGNTFVNGLSYPQASDYFSISAGSYTFDVVAAQPSLTLSVPTTLKMNTVTSVFAVGVFNGNPKLQFVASQVNGIPGVPGTGSDPNAQPNNFQPLTPLAPWLLAMLALIGMSTGVVMRRWVVARQKTTALS